MIWPWTEYKTIRVHSPLHSVQSHWWCLLAEECQRRLFRGLQQVLKWMSGRRCRFEHCCSILGTAFYLMHVSPVYPRGPPLIEPGITKGKCPNLVWPFFLYMEKFVQSVIWASLNPKSVAKYSSLKAFLVLHKRSSNSACLITPEIWPNTEAGLSDGLFWKVGWSLNYNLQVVPDTVWWSNKHFVEAY